MGERKWVEEDPVWAIKTRRSRSNIVLILRTANGRKQIVNRRPSVFAALDLTEYVNAENGSSFQQQLT